MPQTDGKVRDATESFEVPIPENWSGAAVSGGILAQDVDRSIEVFMTRESAGDMDEAVASAWKKWGREAPATERVDEMPADSFWEKTVVTQYRREPGQFHQAIARVHNGDAYVALITGKLAGLQSRGAQANLVVGGLRPVGASKLDLSDAVPDLTAAELQAWTEFAAEQFRASEVPGAAMLLIVDGEVVWKQGFGVKAIGEPEPVTPDTVMMIGSTTKPLTTAVMAQLVSEGKMAWTDPVQKYLPSFRLADEDATQALQVKHLACACTGVPRRDLELFFETRPRSAEDVIASLASYELFTDFGETFQYSNQMVATAGFTAAAAWGGKWGNLSPAYSAMMPEKLFNPLGMSQTTVDFAAPAESTESARPHRRNLSGTYEAMPLELERFVEPVAPAGAVWSSVEDLAKFAQVLLQRGKLADGSTFLEADALETLWAPTVKLSPDTSYGLGWFIEDHHGVRVVEHGGNTFGFTSGLTLIPSAKAALVVLSNGNGANRLADVLDDRLLELLYDQPARVATQAAAAWERSKVGREEFAKKLGPVDLNETEGFLGTWRSEPLGKVKLTARGDKMFISWEGMSSELRRAIDGPYAKNGYMMVEGPLSGLPLRLVDADKLLLGDGAIEYTLTRETP